MISFSHFFEGERVVVGGHGCRAALHFGVKAREGQGRVLALCWLSRLHREPYGAEFIAISGSCTATELSKLLASCLTAIEERAVRYCEKVQSNLDYSKCQGPHESFRIIGSSNDRKREFSDIFGKARTFHRTSSFCQSSHIQLVFSLK